MVAFGLTILLGPSTPPRPPHPNTLADTDRVGAYTYSSIGFARTYAVGERQKVYAEVMRQRRELGMDVEDGLRRRPEGT